MKMEATTENQEDCPFQKERGVTDLKLVVEDKTLFVNKGVLVVASPVFKEMLCFGEKEVDEVTLSEIKYEDIVEFLKCIYPSILKPLTFDTVTQVLPLMHTYKCERQLQQCIEFFTKNISPDRKHIELEKLLLYLSQAKAYGLDKTYEVCLQQACKHCLDTVKSTQMFQNLSEKIKEELFERRVREFETMSKTFIEQRISCQHCKSYLKNKGQFLDTKFSFENPSHYDYKHHGNFFK